MKKTQSDTVAAGIKIDPLAIYDAKQCCQIVGCKRQTLTRYVVEQGFPLKTIGSGRAIGQEILDWMSSRPNVKQKRGPKATTSRKLAASSK